MNLAEDAPQLFHLVFAYLLLARAVPSASSEQARFTCGRRDIFEEFRVRNDAMVDALHIVG